MERNGADWFRWRQAATPNYVTRRASDLHAARLGLHRLSFWDGFSSVTPFELSRPLVREWRPRESPWVALSYDWGAVGASIARACQAFEQELPRDKKSHVFDQLAVPER
jgi:hypothetical protein